MKKHYDPILTKPYLSRVYDSMEFTLADGTTNYDVRTQVAAAFANLDAYTTINLRTDQEITMRLNSTSNPAITITTRPYELDDLIEITNIYLSNSSGATANIKIIGVRKGV